MARALPLSVCSVVGGCFAAQGMDAPHRQRAARAETWDAPSVTVCGHCVAAS
jgi:hypothetical protein